MTPQILDRMETIKSSVKYVDKYIPNSISKSESIGSNGLVVEYYMQLAFDAGAQYACEKLGVAYK